MKLSEDAKLDLIVRRMETDDSVDAPADALTYAKNLFRGRLPEASGILKRIVAVITADLAAGRPAFGERSASVSKARQMLFTASDNAVDLRVQDNGKTRDIRGQVLGDGFSEAAVILMSNDRTCEVAANTDGEFTITGITAGPASLIIRGTDTEILLEGLDL